MPDTIHNDSDGQSWPRISLVTPSLNQGDFLENTIRSVLQQNYPNLEYIIIDGESSDHSLDIIKKYEPWISWWVSEKDTGQSEAINKGFDQSSGTILSWLNADDYLHPSALWTIAEMYLQNPRAQMYVGGNEFVDEKGIVSSTNIPAIDLNYANLFLWLDRFSFVQPSCFFSREAWDRCGPLDVELHFAMDLDLWFKMAATYTFSRTDKILSSARIHPSAKTTRYAYSSLIETCIVFARHGDEKTALKHLEEMATKAAWNEYYLNRILSTPGIRQMRGVFRRIMKSDQKWLEFSSRGKARVDSSDM